MFLDCVTSFATCLRVGPGLPPAARGRIGGTGLGEPSALSEMYAAVSSPAAIIGNVTNWYDPASLPKFRFPPVYEVALVIEFAAPHGHNFIKLARLQDHFPQGYGTITEQNGAPPSSLITEGPPTLALSFGEPPRRIWNAKPGSGRLVQTQLDRMIFNWRASDSGEGYPGYRNALRGEFLELWGAMTEYFASEGLQPPVPVLAEFDYFNKVPLEPGDNLADVVTLIRTPDVEVPGKDTFGRFQFVRDVEESDIDVYRGQIVVVGEPGPPDEGRSLMLTVTSRVLFSGTDDVMDALDHAQALASHSFARLITDEKKRQWEQYQ